MEMMILNSDGDSKHTWNPDDEESIQRAREVYDLHKDKGFTAFHMDGSGETGKLMQEFDPVAGSVLLVPVMAGG